MPFGPFLYADQLHKTLRQKASKKWVSSTAVMLLHLPHQ